MSEQSIMLEIPFEMLMDAVSKLGLPEKRRLWERLEEELAQAEELAWEREPSLQNEIREARAAYENGDYQTLDEYIAQQKSQ